MFHLNEKNMIRLLKEEYTKRVRSFIAEEMTVSYGKDKMSLIAGADQLKVRHDESGLEYTFVKVDETGKNVILLLPEESRMVDTNSMDFDLKSNFKGAYNDSSYENKKYIVVPMQEFIKDYSL